MTRIRIVGEDALCCALGERLVAEILPHWGAAGAPIDTRGITKLVPALPRYLEQARHVQPVLCIADSDGACARSLLARWLPDAVPPSFVFRLAVAEAESWLLADRTGFADGLQVPLSKLPHTADDVSDAKQLLLHLVARSRKRLYRDEIVSRSDPAKRGVGYNVHLCAFVRTRWSAMRARLHAPSLARAVARLQALDAR